jgi:hypothetical protein
MRPGNAALILPLALLACKGKEESRITSESESSGAETAKKPNPAAPRPTSDRPPGKLGSLASDKGGHVGKLNWAVRFGGVEADAIRGVGVDGSGNIYIAGYSEKIGDFGDGKPVQLQGSDAFVASLKPDGTLRWVRFFGGKGQDVAEALAVDAKGNSVVVGSFSDSLDFGGDSISAVGADDAFVAMFDAEGKRLWAKRLGGPDVDSASYVSFDRAGDVLVSGTFRAGASFGDFDLEEAGRGDAFVAVLARADGGVKWARRFGSTGLDIGRAVIEDAAGSLVLLVEYSAPIDFGGGPLESTNHRDVALVKLGRDGSHVWSKSWGNQFDCLALDMALDPAGNIFVTGTFEDKIRLGGQEFSSAGRGDVYVSKYDAKGTHLWSQRFGGKDDDIGMSIVADPEGNAFVAGRFYQSVDFGGTLLKSAGDRDVFLLKLSPQGETRWARRIGGPQRESTRGLALTADGGVIIGGAFHLSADFGGKTLEAAAEKKALIPKSDAFVASFSR